MTTEVLERPAEAIAVQPVDGVSTALAEVSASNLKLTELAAVARTLHVKFKDVAFDVSTTKGMDEAKKARLQLRTEARFPMQELQEAGSKMLGQMQRQFNARAKELIEEVAGYEKPIDQQIKAEEDRKALEKAAREQAEREAAAAIQRRIDAIREMVSAAVGNPSDKITAMAAELSAMEITLEDFGDLAGAAMQAKSQTVAKLEEMAAAAHAAEQAAIEAAAKAEAARIEQERIAAEQKATADRLAAERKALEEQQAAMRAEQAKADREAAAARAKADRDAAAARAEADRQAAADRAAAQKILDDQAAALRAQRDAQEARERAAREEQEAKDRAARQVLEDQERAARAEAQAKADAEAKVERERKEAEEAEAAAQRARVRAEEEAKAAADKRGRDAWLKLFVQLQRAFDMVERSLLIDTFGLDWVEESEAVLALVSTGEAQ